MGRSRYAPRTLALAAALAFAIAGCSDDSGDEPETAGSPAEEQALPEAIPVEGAPSADLEDRLVRKVSITGGPDWMVVAFDSLWVKRDTGVVNRIDPASGKVLAEIGTGRFKPPVCQGIGASDDAIWACPRDGSLIRIDPRKDSIAATIEADKLLDQGRLVSAADHLWVLTDAGNELTGIDLKSNKPATTIALPAACVDVATDGAVLWVTCPQDDLLLQIDAGAGEVTDELELAGAQNASVSDQVWVGFEGGVAQIDPDTLEVVAVYGVYPRLGGSIFATPDAVWVREEDEHFLTHIDPAAQEIVETIEAPKLPSGGDVVVVGDSVWATAYDDTTLVEVRASD